MDSAAAALIVGEWFHSHEEDSPGVWVYRPSSYGFPRARMPRDSISFSADGEAGIGRPGPTDRVERTPGSWRLVDEQVVVQTGHGRTLQLDLHDADHPSLLLRVTPPEGADHADSTDG